MVVEVLAVVDFPPTEPLGLARTYCRLVAPVCRHVGQQDASIFSSLDFSADVTVSVHSYFTSIQALA